MARKPYAAGKVDIPAPQGKTLDYGVGDLVMHKKYGIGQVLSIENGGADYQVRVLFPGHGEKKLLAQLAGLVKQS